MTDVIVAAYLDILLSNMLNLGLAQSSTIYKHVEADKVTWKKCSSKILEVLFKYVIFSKKMLRV